MDRCILLTCERDTNPEIEVIISKGESRKILNFLFMVMVVSSTGKTDAKSCRRRILLCFKGI